MSRLDYLTIAIVGACILAIIFLVYKMTDLFNGGKQDDKIETVRDTVETEEDEVYDYEIDEKVDSTSGNAATDNTSSSKPATSTPATTTTSSSSSSKEMDASSTASEDDGATDGKSYGGNYSYPGGDFMVIAGAFTQKASARKEVNRLKKKGYSTAGLEIFDRGKYAVVMVDQFGNMADAERLIKKLEGDGIKAYIKMKQPG